MILALSIRFRKSVAAFLWLVFYVQLIAPLRSLGETVAPVRRTYPVTPAYLSAYAHGWFPRTLPKVTVEIKRQPDKVVPQRTAMVKAPSAAMRPAEGGPATPEAASFKKVGADKLVDLFTGDFSYSIPLMDVDGYPVNLFYNGGITMEQDASWVGLGWNINPGSVTRNMRGIPDDFDGTDTLVQQENVKPNKTWGGEVSVNGELLGWKVPDVNLSLGFSYNNYLGPALDLGAGVSLNYPIVQTVVYDKTAGDSSTQGLDLKLGLNAKLSSRSGLTLAPSLNANLHLIDAKLDLGVGLSTSYNSRTGIKALNISSQDSWNFVQYMQSQAGRYDHYNSVSLSLDAEAGLDHRFSSSINFARPTYMPTLRMPMQYSNTEGQIEIGWGDDGVATTVDAQGYYSESHIAQTTINKPLVGFMYLENASGHPDAVMDFNRLNDGPVTPNTPIISVPQYSYDVFSIQGEGTGGSIRAYRSDLGVMRDNITTSTDKSLSLGVDIGLIMHFGANVNTASTPTKAGGWDDANNTLNQTLGFSGPRANSTIENVYFRNPGELTVTNDNMINKIGRDNLVRFLVDGSTVTPRAESQLEQFSKNTGAPLGTLSVATANATEPRDKRSQVVTMLTASQAELVGHDTSIRSYLPTLDASNNLQYASIPRVGGFRKGHHISEINVLESSGMRYVYGIPVYNKIQQDFTFTVDTPGNAATNLSTYATNDPTTASQYMSKPGYDGYVNMQQTPAYASAFLLTELLSPDYVDLTGDGVTEDDLGRAVKFNYEKSDSAHRWRTPRSQNGVSGNVAAFNKGLWSERKDDKAIISYGEREAWYLHSIESKSMIAIFKTSPRSDAKGVNGALDGSANASENANMKLDSIMLYTKAELKAYGLAGAVPIKTVHFDYTYTLCPGTPDNGNGGGKLTLNDIYFTFNGQPRASKDMYVFNYGTVNPSYAYNAADRWGTYKDPASNPSGMTNIDYPYTSTTKALDDQYASAWSLQKVLLPSGGQMEMTYEADDYAYVQNRRACNMYNIYGFGTSTNYTQFNMLYTVFGNQDQNYVYIQLPTPLQNSNPALARQEIYAKYLQGLNQLAFKLYVDMPKGPEPLTVYAGIDDYGLCPNSSNNQVIYLKLTQVDGQGALANAAVHYLIENLPGQAFPGYDLSDQTGLTDFFNMITAELSGLKNAFTNAVQQMRSDGKASAVNLATSFVRLASPTMFKYGGGQRVKRILLKDNWNALTGQYTSQYGQDYDYTTTADINGVSTQVSSGVASYEPGIGSEENPFREILQFEDKLPLASAQYGAIEMPMVEGLFPTSMVGYSQVTVRSINRNGTHGDSVVRSAIGSQVTQFYTAKDYPTFFTYTPMSTMDYHKEPFFTFLNKETIDRRTSSQGFLVETNDMHGKMKLQAAYSESDPLTPISYTRYTYKNTGANGMNDLVNFVHHDQGGAVTSGNIGVDMELMSDAREFSVISNGQDNEGQIDFFTYLPFPIFAVTLWPLHTYVENLYRAVTTTKLINFHAITDSTIVNDKGSTVTTKIVAYDSETGNPIVTQTGNEFNDPVYNVTLPAYWAYSGLGPAYQNINSSFIGVTFYNGKITSGISDMSVFESGDELLITSPGNVNDCNGDAFNVNRVWAFDLSKNINDLTVPTASRQMVFLDSSGKVYSMANVNFTILRSGHRNNIDAVAGKLTAMQNPIQTVSGAQQLVLSNADNVVDAFAADYREKWQVDNDEILHKVYYTVCGQQMDSISCAGILEKHINPYQKGLLGNYKVCRDYVYYGSRNETDPTVNTAIRHNGYINNFTSFWGFDANSHLVPNTASPLWVWKTQLTKINAKGQEIETENALGQYTAAQYGYARNLPVAMTQNSRLGASFFDGMEDYSYNESLNNAFQNKCAQRYIDFSNLGANASIIPGTANNWAHSGLYMLQINNGAQVARSIPVAAAPIDSFNFIMNPDTTQVLTNLGGNITYVYSTIKSEQNNTSGTDYTTSFLNLGAQATLKLPDSSFATSSIGGNLQLQLQQYTKISTAGTYTFTVKIVSGTYTLPVTNLTQSITTSIRGLDGTDYGDVETSNSSSQKTVSNSLSVTLCPGMYSINTGIFESDPVTSNSIPATNQYSVVASGGTLTSYKSLTTQGGCTYIDPIAATDSMLNQTFALVPGQHMWLSAWVREATDTACCIAGYAKDHIQLQFPGSKGTSPSFVPSGPVIEGWQKIEGDFIVPTDATTANLILGNDNSSAVVYFDDIRLQPFNADMESYVYDPQSLRLTSKLDQNNYASFYDYDQEGQLVRIKQETAQGIKTVSETRTAKQKLITNVQ